MNENVVQTRVKYDLQAAAGDFIHSNWGWANNKENTVVSERNTHIFYLYKETVKLFLIQIR